MARGVGLEPGHLASEEPYRGDGLAAAFTAALEAAGELPPIGCVYSSFNGERYWAKEFGVAMLRNRDAFDPAHQMEHPAECFGDLGAAHGAVLLAMACLGLHKGYRRSPALVYSSSDLGRRAAIVLERIPHQPGGIAS
jgi:3-oxoacyl-[acyl-carrier-protein] synthase-1